MSGAWPKVIRDPLHGVIPFDDTACDRLLVNLINTREFQRLRRIKQLGVSQLVFPGADHSRFAHSIGVMYTARKFLARLASNSTVPLTEDHRTVVLTASLLHDVGHGPFSHAFERITEESHERRTLEIIQDESTDIHVALTNHENGFADRVSAFFDENISSEDDRSGVPRFLANVVSSQLDADRFDYLPRDSYATGARQGNFDVDWLLQHLRADPEKNRLVLGRKALYAAEAYIFARYHMYRTVYFHKTTRAAEVMLRLLFERYRTLLTEANGARARRGILPDAPRAVLAVFSPRQNHARMPLGDYLDLDDHSVTEFLKSCCGARDRLLRDLGSGLLHRRLYKSIDATDADKAAIGRFVATGRERMNSAGRDPDYTFVADSPSDTPYKPYDPDANDADDNTSDQIYIDGSDGRARELSACSERVNQLKRTYTLLRYYYPEDIRGDIEQIAAVEFRKRTR